MRSATFIPFHPKILRPENLLHPERRALNVRRFAFDSAFSRDRLTVPPGTPRYPFMCLTLVNAGLMLADACDSQVEIDTESRKGRDPQTARGLQLEVT